MSGHIYILQVGTDGPIKIGYTAFDIKRRIRAIQAGSPYVLRWIGVYPGTREDERIAHSFLKSSHLRAEWFHPTSEVLAFANLKSPNFEPLVVINRIYRPKRAGRGSGSRPISVTVPARSAEFDA